MRRIPSIFPQRKEKTNLDHYFYNSNEFGRYEDGGDLVEEDYDWEDNCDPWEDNYDPWEDNYDHWEDS